MARLRILAPEGSRDVTLKDRFSIGRTEGADLVLDDKGISRRHCEFVARDGGFAVSDLGSSNGTLVNGDKATGERPLVDGDKVRVGGITLTYLARDADYVLRFQGGEHSGREIALTADRTTFGRRPDSTLAFVDVKVSGVHLEIVKDGTSCVLRDLGSTNGTFLGGHKVTEVALSHGDRVKLGQNEFVFVDLSRGAASVESAGDPSATAKSAALPPPRSKAPALLALTGLVVAIGGAGAWYWKQSQRSGAATSARVAPPAPSGTLLVEDWSFEEAAAVGAQWSAELGDGFSTRTSAGGSGSSVFGATVESGHAVASARKPVAIRGGRALRFSGQLAGDDRALVSAAIRFIRQGDETTEARQLSVVAARSEQPGFTPFDVVMVAPGWANGAEIVLVARGDGVVAVDDLALEADATVPRAANVGDLTVQDRGGSFAVEHGAPLLELLAPYGSGTLAPTEEGGAPARVELPPGGFSASVVADGARLTAHPGRAPLAPEGFAALLAPELSTSGVTLLLGGRSEHHFGAFDVTGAKSLLVGAAAERIELQFAAPQRIVGVERGDSLELRFPTSAELVVTLRTNFDAERKEAADLLAKAQQAWRDGRAGPALQLIRELRGRVPHDEKTAELARQLDAEIVPTLETELSAIDADALAAEFLGSLVRYRKTLTRATKLLEQSEGLEAAKDLTARVERMKATVAAMERERREGEARRLLKLARAYQAQKPPLRDRGATAKQLLEELEKSYADTAAAAEARGGGR